MDMIHFRQRESRKNRFRAFLKLGSVGRGRGPDGQIIFLLKSPIRTWMMNSDGTLKKDNFIFSEKAGQACKAIGVGRPLPC
jgi:hypothetical protein